MFAEQQCASLRSIAPNRYVEAAHRQPDQAPFFPFPNKSSYLLTKWFYNGTSTKSLADTDRLVADVLLEDGFNIPDLYGFSANREAKRLDHNVRDVLQVADGWREAEVALKVPRDMRQNVDERSLNACEDNAMTFKVPGLFYRPLIEIMKTAIQDPKSSFYHFTPYKQYWKPTSTSAEERVYCEQYACDDYIKMDKDVQELPRAPADTMERVAFPIMVWSDATHLANFGTASLWPIYIFFGAQSKYEQAKPTSGACHHVAYIPSVRKLLII